MSIVATYCKCADGKWYKEPVWHGPHVRGIYSWFICLDDKDPPELVVQLGATLPSLSWLKYNENHFYSCGTRWFGVEDGYFPAKSVFGDLREAPPIPQKWESVFDEMPNGQGVFFGENVWTDEKEEEYQKMMHKHFDDLEFDKFRAQLEAKQAQQRRD